MWGFVRARVLRAYVEHTFAPGVASAGFTARLRRFVVAKGKAHPGFKAVQSKIQGEGYSKKAAGAILAAATRGASAKAKKANPRLKRVKG